MAKNVETFGDGDVILTQLVLFVSGFFVVFGGVIPFVFQYREMRSSRNPRGFSLYVCLALLISNILRITFWFGKRFEVQLLAQSVVIISCMLFVIELAVRLRRKYVIPSKAQYSLWDGQLVQHFWHWSDFSSYCLFLAFFVAGVYLISMIGFRFPTYIEAVGFAALLIEALVGAPQLVSNYSRSSTMGMSVKMVGFWFFGDLLKTVYFIVRQTPAQFWICGCLQIFVDIIILSQVFFYRNRNRLRRLFLSVSGAVSGPTSHSSSSLNLLGSSSLPEHGSASPSKRKERLASASGPFVDVFPETNYVPTVQGLPDPKHIDHNQQNQGQARRFSTNATVSPVLAPNTGDQSSTSSQHSNTLGNVGVEHL